MANFQLKVSVAMCTYNGAAYLREQLDSIARQSRLPNELVICDDGSSDSTPALLADFAASAPFPVRIYRNPNNLGSTKNFEQAIGLCTGDLIALCDQDDIWIPEKLALQAKLLEQDPGLNGVFTDAYLIDSESNRLRERLWSRINFTPAEQRRYISGDGLSTLLRRNVVTGATLMIRGEAQNLFMPIPQTLVHDGWIAWMLTLHSKLEPTVEPLIYYRIHDNQQCGASPGPSSILEKMISARHTGSNEYFTAARRCEDLERHFEKFKDPRSDLLLAALREKSTLLYGRGSLSGNKLRRLHFVIRNLRSYRKYFSLWAAAKDLCGSKM
jgi:glycosyltransferase involved in cell wall biosynthesis